MDNLNTKEIRKKRYPVKGDILVDGKIMFKCIDISEGGIYLYTGRSYEKNKIVTVTLPIKDNPLTVKARVQHSQTGVGMGLQFIDLSDKQKDAIKKLIMNIEKRFVKPLKEKKKILLIEENDISRQIHKNNLFLEGFSLTEARDGMEAIKFLEKNKPDLIILDLYMEKMDGFSVISTLKKTPFWAEIPVIVFSASDSPDILEKAKRAGADELLVKMATSPSKLAETVRSVLQR